MSHISNTQKDPSDIQGKKPLKPHEFYNKYIRSEDEPVLSEEQYAKIALAARNAISKEKLKSEYPLTPDDAFTNTGQSD